MSKVNEKSKQQNIPYCREDSTIHFRIACKVHESITYVTFVMKKAFKRKKHKQLQALQNAIIDKKAFRLWRRQFNFNSWRDYIGEKSK